MYPIPAVYPRIFNQMIKILHQLVDGDLLSILVKTAGFYFKQLQNDGAWLKKCFLQICIAWSLKKCC